MAGNESIAVVPTNVGDPTQLRKFLLLLVEKLDVVLGYRGQSPYLTADQLTSVVSQLQDLPSILSEAQALIDELTDVGKNLSDQVESIGSELDVVVSRLDTSTTLAAPYYDFNYTEYASLVGWYEFTALGSAILNPPVALVPATTYTVLMRVSPVSTGGITQEVYIVSATTKTYHKRAGTTFALALSLGWF